MVRRDKSRQTERRARQARHVEMELPARRLSERDSEAQYEITCRL
jgi:hypothetical protein